MSMIQRGPLDEDDRLPWLEPVEDEEPEPRVGIGKLVIAVIAAVAVIGLAAGALRWWNDRGGAGGSGELIAAPEGSYKVRPDVPGGMRIEGEGESAYATSAGEDVTGAIDVSALPETPVTEQAPAAAPVVPVAVPPSSAAPKAGAPVPATAKGTAPAVKAEATPKAALPKAVTPATPVPSKAAPADLAPAEPAASGGGTIQLGAFSSQAKAEAAWKSLSKRFTALAPLAHVVLPVKTDSGTLYRLRASADGQGTAICGRLRVAGETCSVVR